MEQVLILIVTEISDLVNDLNCANDICYLCGVSLLCGKNFSQVHRMTTVMKKNIEIGKVTTIADESTISTTIDAIQTPKKECVSLKMTIPTLEIHTHLNNIHKMSEIDMEIQTIPKAIRHPITTSTTTFHPINMISSMSGDFASRQRNFASCWPTWTGDTQRSAR